MEDIIHTWDHICVQFMSELSGGNIVTTYGKNLWNIQNRCEENVTSRNLSKSLRFAPVPNQEKWRIEAAKDMLEVKWNISEISNMELTMEILMNF